MLKITTVLAALALMWNLIVLWQTGKQTARSIQQDSLRDHRKKVLGIAGLTVAAVVLIEWQVQVSPIPYAVSMWLFIVHLILVGLLSAVFAAIVIRFSGLRSKHWHATFAYSFLLLYVFVIATGAVLLYQLP